MRERAAVSNPSKSVRENLYRPCGTRPDLKLYPGLPSEGLTYFALRG